MSSDTQSKKINQVEPAPDKYGRVLKRGATDCKGGGASMPAGHLYLSSNNSDKPSSEKTKLSSNQKKQAHVVVDNVKRLINSVGVQQVAFITLTFKENLTNNKEASRRFNNLNRRFISDMFGSWALQKEEQKRGAWHYHILIDCLGDVKSGFDFDSYDLAQKIRKVYHFKGVKFDKIPIKARREIISLEAKAFSKATPRLRIIKDKMNQVVGNYGFGRCQVLPIKTEAEFVALYVGKYVSKHVGHRSEESKGVRLSSYSRGFARSCTKFQWFTDNSAKWRKNVKTLASYIGANEDSLPHKLGCKWAFMFTDLIIDIQKYSKESVLQFIKNNSPHTDIEFRDNYGGHLQVCGETGFLTDEVTGEILF